MGSYQSDSTDGRAGGPYADSGSGGPAVRASCSAAHAMSGPGLSHVDRGEVGERAVLDAARAEIAAAPLLWRAPRGLPVAAIEVRVAPCADKRLRQFSSEREPSRKRRAGRSGLRRGSSPVLERCEATPQSVGEHLEVWAKVTVGDDREVELPGVGQRADADGNVPGEGAQSGRSPEPACRRSRAGLAARARWPRRHS